MMIQAILVFSITWINVLDKSIWGELLEQDTKEDGYDHHSYNDTMEPRTETEIKSGISSIISGMETPEIELQKRPAASKITSSVNPNDTVPKPLYQVLEPVQVRPIEICKF